MNDEFLSRNPPPLRPRSSGGGRIVVASALLAFVIGGGLVGYLAWAKMLPFEQIAPDSIAVRPLATLPSSPDAPSPSTAVLPASEAALAVRLAALEARLAQIDLRAQAASGNASRAEALLVALAARRAIDRGADLGYLEDQLRLRFGERHGQAVGEVLAAAKAKVTLEALDGDLQLLATRLTGAPAKGDFWARTQQELAGLFVIRHDNAPSPAPQNRLDRARMLLAAGKLDEAIREVQTMPGQTIARDWVERARRYDAAHRALDLLESAALLETVTPKGSDGKAAEQPGLGQPAI